MKALSEVRRAVRRVRIDGVRISLIVNACFAPS
jgi:hypothetical protein